MEPCDSTTESEDSNAEYLTEKKVHQFSTVLYSIKNRDSELYDPSHKIFSDSDKSNLSDVENTQETS